MNNYLFPPEKEIGNIEYKRKIDDKSNKRMTKLKSQMLWRLEEGFRLNNVRKAIYYIGIEDDGSISNLSIEELKIYLKNFDKIIDLAGAEKESLNIIPYNIQNSKKVFYAKIVISKHSQVVSKEIKVALLGNTNSGKSTLLSVLTFSKLDNGKGSARSNVLRYDHEFVNGVTSSIKHDILGFNHGIPINYTNDLSFSWEN